MCVYETVMWKRGHLRGCEVNNHTEACQMCELNENVGKGMCVCVLDTQCAKDCQIDWLREKGRRVKEWETER